MALDDDDFVVIETEIECSEIGKPFSIETAARGEEDPPVYAGSFPDFLKLLEEKLSVSFCGPPGGRAPAGGPPL